MVMKLLTELRKFQENLQQNNSGTVTIENHKEIPK